MNPRSGYSLRGNIELVRRFGGWRAALAHLYMQCHRGPGLGFRAEGLGVIWGLGFGVWGLGFWVCSLVPVGKGLVGSYVRCWVSGVKRRAWNQGFRVAGFRVKGLGRTQFQKPSVYMQQI